MKRVQILACCLLATVIGFSSGCAKKKSKTDGGDKTTKTPPKKTESQTDDNTKSTKTDSKTGKTEKKTDATKTEKKTDDGKTTGIKKPTKISKPKTGNGKKTSKESGSGAKRKLRGPKLGGQD